jgi:CheY-like chemotaxis protein
VVQSVAVGAQAKGLDLVLDCHENVPPFVVGDATRIRQILHNLIGNAGKFTREGHVLLRIALDEGGGDAGEPGRELHFIASVEDSGIGIDEAGQKRLFQEFSQVDDSTTRQFGGTGLGLFIVKQLVGLMGGTISVSSTAGLGTTFNFDFYCGVATTKPSRDARNRRTKAQKVQRLKVAPLPNRPLTIVGLFRTKAGGDAFVRYAKMVANGRADVVVALRGTEAATALRTVTSAGGAAVLFADTALTTPDLYAASHLPASVTPAQRKARQAVGVVVAPAHTGAGDWHLTVGSPLYPAPLSKILARALEVLSGTRALSDGDVSSSEADAGVKSLRRVRRDVRRDNKAPLILVVDDFESMRDVTCAALVTLGYRTATAVNGRDGVDALIAADEQDDPVDVVIMDIEMPVMDGHEATRTIRALGLDDCDSDDDVDDLDDRLGRRARRRLLARTPIIAMTANSLRDDRTRCFEAGMDEFAGKPVSRAKLAEVIGAMLDKRAKDVATNGRSEAGGSIASYVDLPEDPEAVEPLTSAALPKQLRVLLADDAVEVRTVVSLVLKSLGCIVDEHGDGAPAVSAFAKHPVSHYHLVLLDLHMPDIGGIQAAEEMRTEERRRAADEAVYMVAVTGEDEGSVGVECVHAGFDGVISKPVTRQGLEKLTEKVWEQLRHKKAPTGQRKKSHEKQRRNSGSLSISQERKRSVSRSPARIRTSRKSSVTSSPARRLSMDRKDSGGESSTTDRPDNKMGSKSSSRRRKKSLKAKSSAPPDPGEPERRVQQRRSVAAATLSPPVP